MFYTLKIHLVLEVNYYLIILEVFFFLLISSFILLLVWLSSNSLQKLYLRTSFDSAKALGLYSSSLLCCLPNLVGYSA